VLVAIPNAGPPLDWNRAFERVRSTGHASPSKAALLDPAKMSAEDLGRLDRGSSAAASSWPRARRSG
jgi:hypothetical protein